MIGPDNTIAYNGTDGIVVYGSTSLKNTFTRNSIYSNAGLGIDNVNGGNLRLPPPRIVGLSLPGGVVTGTACFSCTIEIFSDYADEGRIYEGSTTADGAGNWAFNKGAALAGPWVNATATDAVGNTSEFSSYMLKIGVAAPLTGGVASLGWQIANAVQLAISQTNAAGGIAIGQITYTLGLVTADDACNATQAITAANTLLNARVVAVVGHACSSASLAAQPIYSAAGVPMVSPSSTNPQLTQQGYTTTFRTISHDGTPPTLLATYFRNPLGLARSAVVEMQGWYQWATDFYSGTFTALGGVVTSRRVVTSVGNFTATLTAIQAENPQAIFYADVDPTRGGQFSRTAHDLGMTNVIIGWDPFDNNESLLTTYAGAAGAAAEGDYAAMSFRRTQDMPGWPAFLAAYQAAGFTNQPSDPGVLGAYAYDAAKIIMAAVGRAYNLDPATIRNQIAATSNYSGVVGAYQGFDARGDVIPQWAWLERYRNGQWAIVQPHQIFLPVVMRSASTP